MLLEVWTNYGVDDVSFQLIQNEKNNQWTGKSNLLGWCGSLGRVLLLSDILPA